MWNAVCEWYDCDWDERGIFGKVLFVLVSMVSGVVLSGAIGMAVALIYAIIMGGILGVDIYGSGFGGAVYDDLGL